MTIDDQVRALRAVKLLSAIRRYRPQLFAAIQEFAKHEFPELAAVSRKDAVLDSELSHGLPVHRRQNSEAATGQQAAHSGKVA